MHAGEIALSGWPLSTVASIPEASQLRERTVVDDDLSSSLDDEGTVAVRVPCHHQGWSPSLVLIVPLRDLEPDETTDGV